VHAVAHDYDAIEGQSGLGAVPGDELIDGVLVDSARSWRAEAVEHRRFAMIQIRQPKHSATVIRLDSMFAHGDGLPCRRISTTANRLDDASGGKRAISTDLRCGQAPGAHEGGKLAEE